MTGVKPYFDALCDLQQANRPGRERGRVQQHLQLQVAGN